MDYVLIDMVFMGGPTSLTTESVESEEELGFGSHWFNSQVSLENFLDLSQKSRFSYSCQSILQ